MLRFVVKKVNSRMKLGMRLPTEAEWEYACRAGTKTAFYWGNVFDGSQASCMREYGTSSRVCGLPDSPTPVDRYVPNTWGIFDMSGNVSEWCEDWYAEYKEEAIDPMGPVSGEERVLRGGCLNKVASACRSAARAKVLPEFNALAGLRICCTAE